jgi:hypothetical protein
MSQVKSQVKSTTPARRRRGAADVSPFGHGDIPTSLLLIFPLFLAYEVGVMFSPTVNGVDFVTRWVFAAVGYDRERYLYVHLGLAVAFLALLIYLRTKRGFTLKILPPVLIESVIYALTLGTAIVFIMDRVLGLGATELGGRAQAAVMSLGAGVHEELVFRLGLMGGAIAALTLARVSRGPALVLALGASAALFSAAHHAGPLGEPFDTSVFVYRMLAGVAFGLIFYYRSLAHAVYAHFLYDVYVMVLRS